MRSNGRHFDGGSGAIQVGDVGRGELRYPSAAPAVADDQSVVGEHLYRSPDRRSGHAELVGRARCRAAPDPA